MCLIKKSDLGWIEIHLFLYGRGQLWIRPRQGSRSVLEGEGRDGDQCMETPEWINWVAGGIGISILIGGFLMMFTTVWTTKR